MPPPPVLQLQSVQALGALLNRLQPAIAATGLEHSLLFSCVPVALCPDLLSLYTRSACHNNESYWA